MTARALSNILFLSPVLVSNLLLKLEIDDAVDAIPVHAGNGIWGCIATGLFTSPTLYLQAGYASADPANAAKVSPSDDRRQPNC